MRALSVQVPPFSKGRPLWSRISSRVVLPRTPEARYPHGAFNSLGAQYLLALQNTTVGGACGTIEPSDPRDQSFFSCLE